MICRECGKIIKEGEEEWDEDGETFCSNGCKIEWKRMIKDGTYCQ